MIEKIDLTKILFLDIETVCGRANFEEVPPRMRELWHKKAKQLRLLSEDLLPESVEEEQAVAHSYLDKAAIYAEWGKIICISVGIFSYDSDKQLQFRLKSFYSDDETELLENFTKLLDTRFNDTFKYYLCGHNIKEFDVPYICRRLIINRLPLPALLQVQGKKPWETKFLLDTMELWKFGDGKAFTSLNLLTAVFDIPTPKDDIDGSQVGRVYWTEGDLPRIASYCQKDVLATAQVYLAMQGLLIIEESQISYAP